MCGLSTNVSWVIEFLTCGYKISLIVSKKVNKLQGNCYISLIDNIVWGIDYGHPERKQPSLHGQKFNPNPKFLGTAEAYFVCHIGPIFQICLVYAFIGCPQSVFNRNLASAHQRVKTTHFYDKISGATRLYLKRPKKKNVTLNVYGHIIALYI